METIGENISDLHNQAMDLAQKAHVMLIEACGLEAVAANMAIELGLSSLTKAVLCRSAASIAIHIGFNNVAAEMIQKGLESDPPPEIEEEILLLQSQLTLTNSGECDTMQVSDNEVRPK